MKHIYVIQMHTKTIPARLIRFFTKYKYSHVALSLDKSCDVTYSFGRRNPRSIRHAGFVVEYKDGAFFQLFNQTKCKIIELEVTDQQYENIQERINEMISHSQEYVYDYFGIILRFFRLPIKFKNRYVCSYFVGAILQEAGVCDFGKDSMFVRPKDFSNIYNTKEIYAGYYKNYTGIIE